MNEPQNFIKNLFISTDKQINKQTNKSIITLVDGMKNKPSNSSKCTRWELSPSLWFCLYDTLSIH